MTLTAGMRLGPYEVVAPLGAGGMGEVYRARDTKLGRDVALKVLPEAFATDPDRLARFQREATTLASLNHPNIGAIHGLEESSGVTALVMELVEGEDLAERIARGPIPLDDCLPIVRQIADALEAAHEHGIVHRDLKPANIKVRSDGSVKVLDFGLAKALEPQAGSAPATSPSLSPTLTAATELGVILGTAAYMSPEQARGKRVDHRTDIWSFGCVTFELLTSRRAFAGDEVSDVLAEVLKTDPDWTLLPPDTPAALQRLLRRCLTKDSRRRLQHIGDARIEIDEAQQAALHPIAPPQSLHRHERPLWALAAVALAVAAGYGAWMLKPPPPRSIAQFPIAIDDGSSSISGLALSPDGTRMAYVSSDRIYLRAFDRLEPTMVAGGDNPPLATARSPFFSPDGRWVGFWEAGQLKKVSVSGGAAVAVCAASPPPAGITWAADNSILFGRYAADAPGIWRVSSDGGTPERILSVDRGQRVQRPELLPDGRTVLFTLAATPNFDEAQIVIQPLDGGPRQILVNGGTDARYVPTGHLIYVLHNTLLAVRFDVRSRAVQGEPVPVVEGVLRPLGSRGASGAFAVTPAGTLAYIRGTAAETLPRRTLAWVDRGGRETPIPAPPRAYLHPRLSPDGTRVAVEFTDDFGQSADVAVWDFNVRTWTRVTSDPARDGEQAWTADGRHLLFVSWRKGPNGLFWQPSNGAGTAEQILGLENQSRALPALSPDGRHVVMRYVEQGSSYLAMVDLDAGSGDPPVPRAGGKPRPLVKTPFEEYNAEISPHARWIAYQSNTSGNYEVYVQPFPDVTKGLWPVSGGGGTEPLWSRDGRELFYRSPSGAVMRVPVAPGSVWVPNAPAQLFEASAYALAANPDLRPTLSRTYDVAPDGRRFLMLKNADAPGRSAVAPRVVIVQNWLDELKRLVPLK